MKLVYKLRFNHIQEKSNITTSAYNQYHHQSFLSKLVLIWNAKPYIHRHTLSPRCTMFDLFIIHGVFKVQIVFFGQEKKKFCREKFSLWDMCFSFVIFYYFILFFWRGWCLTQFLQPFQAFIQIENWCNN